MTLNDRNESLINFIERAQDYLNPEDVTCVIYHKNCKDGETAAMCAWEHIGDGDNSIGKNSNKIDYIALHHKETIPFDSLKGHNVLIVDFSFNTGDLKKAREYAKKVMILDHHISALREHTNTQVNNITKTFSEVTEIMEDGCFIRMDHSGAALSWFYFNYDRYDESYKSSPNPSYQLKSNLPLFVELIEDRDLWKWDHRELSEPLYYGLNKKSCEYNGYYDFRNLEKYYDLVDLVDVITDGKVVLKENKEYIEKICDRSERRIIKLKYVEPSSKRILEKTYDIMILEMESPKLISEISEYLYLNNDVDFTMVWFPNKHNKTRFDNWYLNSWVPGSVKKFTEYGNLKFHTSLRTNKSNIDVSKVMEYYGGGGHKKAAGCMLEFRPTELLIPK